jgi:anti-anti-sigma factor
MAAEGRVLFSGRFSAPFDGAFAMLLELAPGWTMDLERGPDWLYIHVRPPLEAGCEEIDLAETVWEKLEQEFTYRLVLELDELPAMRSWTINELVKLHKRIVAHDGMLRLCGVSDANQEALRLCRLHDRFPQYRTRNDAVMGHRPTQPR